jgi:hypothetical protein
VVPCNKPAILAWLAFSAPLRILCDFRVTPVLDRTLSLWRIDPWADNFTTAYDESVPIPPVLLVQGVIRYGSWPQDFLF